MPQQFHSEDLLAPDPLLDLVRRDAAAGEEIPEELAVIDVGRSHRDVVGHLPSHDAERPLPRGDVVVLGVRDDTIEIEENGFQGHGF